MFEKKKPVQKDLLCFIKTCKTLRSFVSFLQRRFLLRRCFVTRMNTTAYRMKIEQWKRIVAISVPLRYHLEKGPDLQKFLSRKTQDQPFPSLRYDVDSVRLETIFSFLFSLVERSFDLHSLSFTSPRRRFFPTENGVFATRKSTSAPPPRLPRAATTAC